MRSLLISWLSVGVAMAAPGPASVVVVANAEDPESLALAGRYAEARAIPAGLVCALSLPDGDLSLADYQARLLAPLLACLGPRADALEAAVLVRGVPRRVSVDGELVSTAAALGAWRSTLDGAPLLGADPARQVPCGAGRLCPSARWRNPFRAGPFRPDWSAVDQGVVWRPLLVTALDGRDAAEAEALLHSALEAERDGPGDAPFLLMDAADGARGVLDPTLDEVAEALRALGVLVERLPFDGELEGRTFGGLVTGAPAIGRLIEGNHLVPGALVDNLTSFGAAPVNFGHDEELQVSVARFIAAGAAGVHGTVAEPLNNCFPDRRFLVEAVEGATLAEAYHRALPFAYWKNLVLGDPLAAPWAVRPAVRITVGVDGAVEVEVDDPRSVQRLRVFVDGEAAFDAPNTRRARVCPAGEGGRVLAVAQVRDAHPVKGWAWLDAAWPAGPCVAIDAGMEAGPVDLGGEDAAPPSDAGGVDMGRMDAAGPTVDAGTVVVRPTPEGGCRASGRGGGWGFGLALALWARRRRV